MARATWHEFTDTQFLVKKKKKRKRREKEMPIKPRKSKLEEERYLEVKINDENLIPGTNQKITKKMILTSTRIGNCSG